MHGPRYQLANRDAVDWLRDLPSHSVDLAVTDPAYESLEKHRAIGTTTRLKHSKASSNDWFTIFPNSRFDELFAEIHRVLRADRHFYLFCDQETMFVAKPIAEQAGFKFWKPIVWDKCLGPDTPVWTARGVIRIGGVTAGDRVAVPEGGSAIVRATRRTRADSLRLSLSDGSQIIASREHRFMLSDGQLVEATHLGIGSRLCARPVKERSLPDAVEVTAVESIGVQELVDISIDHPDELFVLGNGVVTHNCKIGMGYHYRARYELILFFEKGKRKLNDLGVADIIEAPRVHRGYPAEKPVEVSEVLVRQSTHAGELVIDPFAGSGSVGVAAARLRRDFAGTDICAEAIDIASSRLEEAGAVGAKVFAQDGPPVAQLELLTGKRGSFGA